MGPRMTEPIGRGPGSATLDAPHNSAIVARGRRNDHDAAEPEPHDGGGAGRLVLEAREPRRPVLTLPLVVVAEAVVLPQPALLLRCELLVGVDLRRVLDQVLVDHDADVAVLRELRPA